MLDATEIEEIKSRLKEATYEQLDEIINISNTLKTEKVIEEAENRCKLHRR